MDLIGWLLTINSVIGAILNSHKRIEGFYVWVIGNTGWVLYNLDNQQYPLACLFFIYLIISIMGILQWRKKN